MKIKTQDLTGVALDWLVAKCEGYETEISNGGWVVFDTHQDNPPPTNDYDDSRYQRYSPSTDWAQGGPIIERDQITLRFSENHWIAEWWADNSGMAKNPAQRFCHNRYKVGPTPLIAAMRCYVASQLGDEVDIPDELVEA